MMKNRTFIIIAALSTISFVACSLNSKVDNSELENALELSNEVQKTVPHRYGGWYCPDNLGGFPAVDISEWENVPVINGRMPTKEETQTGASLIFVDAEKYPNAKPLDMTMPKLATYYNQSSQRRDLIIVIQAINITGDSIVGFRFLNGGNGSARLRDIQILSEDKIEMIPKTKFVSHEIKIEASQKTITEVLTGTDYTAALQPTFDHNKQLEDKWRENSNVNYLYSNSGFPTASYANNLFGNFYVQNDYNHLLYTEKFILLENPETKNTTLEIVCGPFADDYETQQKIITKWAKKVKKLSEF